MKKILVIEDDGPVRAGVSAALRRHGYNVLDTAIGAEGLSLAMSCQPDLILSDVNLPGLTGLDVLKRLRARLDTSAIPVVLMTSQTQKVDARSSMNLGADDFLAKPFTVEQMLETIHARLERQAGVQRAVEAHNQAERISTSEKLRLQTLALEAAANGIAITDRDGKILWVNPAFSKLTGYEVEELAGQNPRVLKSGEHAREFYENLWMTITAGNVWHGELINKRKDGSLYHEEMTVTPVCNDQGEVQNFIAIKQDVTRRKETELALARERDLLKSLMDNLPDFIYFKDVHSRFLRINCALARHLGLPNPEMAIGKTEADFIAMRLARQILVDERRLFATGQPILGLEERSDTNNEIKWVSSTKVPIFGPNRKVIGLVGISRDITERKRIEGQLER